MAGIELADIVYLAITTVAACYQMGKIRCGYAYYAQYSLHL